MATIALRKIGNSVGLGVPKVYLESLGLNCGSKVEIDVVDNCLVIRPMHEKLTLEALCSGITPENMHSESFADEPVGAEII